MAMIHEKRAEYYRARDTANRLRRELRQMEIDCAVSKLKRLPPQQRAVLQSMAERDPYCQYGYSFDTIGRDANLNRKQVCRACRALRRLGFVRFVRGMWTDDGEPAGSGYSITKAGVAWWENKEAKKDNDQ